MDAESRLEFCKKMFGRLPTEDEQYLLDEYGEIDDFEFMASPYFLGLNRDDDNSDK